MLSRVAELPAIPPPQVGAEAADQAPVLLAEVLANRVLGVGTVAGSLALLVAALGAFRDDRALTAGVFAAAAVMLAASLLLKVPSARRARAESAAPVPPYARIPSVQRQRRIIGAHAAVALVVYPLPWLAVYAAIAALLGGSTLTAAVCAGFAGSLAGFGVGLLGIARALAHWQADTGKELYSSVVPVSEVLKRRSRRTPVSLYARRSSDASRAG